MAGKGGRQVTPAPARSARGGAMRARAPELEDLSSEEGQRETLVRATLAFIYAWSVPDPTAPCFISQIIAAPSFTDRDGVYGAEGEKSGQTGLEAWETNPGGRGESESPGTRTLHLA